MKTFLLGAIAFLCLFGAPGHAQTAGAIGNNITGGTCSGNGFVNSLSPSGVLGCSTPAGTGGYPNRISAGNSLATAVTSCGSTPTVIEVSANLAPAANVTVPANCALEGDGGVITPTSGTVVTINGPVYSPTNTQMFSVSSGGSFTGLRGEVPVEWFGAVGDGVYPAGTGTDNTAKLQAAINSLTSGHIRLDTKVYRTTGTLAISTNSVGIAGGAIGNTYYGNSSQHVSPTSMIMNTVAGDDILALNQSQWTDLHDFELTRTVLPTGSAKGIADYQAQGIHMTRVTSLDSIMPCYFNQAAEDGSGEISDSTCAWLLTGYSGTLYGVYLDSANGDEEDTIYLRNVGGNAGSTSGATSYCYYVAGSSIADVDVEFAGCAGDSYGIGINGSGSGAYHSADILFHWPTLDEIKNSAVVITNLPASEVGAVNIDHPWVFMAGNTPAFDIENSSGVQVSNGEIFGGAPAFKLVNDADLGIVNNLIQGPSTNAIQASGTSFSTFTGNRLRGANSLSAAFGLTSSPSNTFGMNTLNLTATNGFSFDSASTGNSLCGNIFGSSVSTAISDASGSSGSCAQGGTAGPATPVAATPTASPAAGTYSTAPTVTLADSTTGAVIHYTLDGSTPTASSATYSSALTVSASETIKAIAVASGYSNSGALTASFVISSGSASGTDSFTGSSNATLSGSWTEASSNGSNAVVQSGSGGIQAYGPGSSIAIYTGSGAFPANQSAQLVAISPGQVGPCVRMTASGSGYCWRIDYSQIEVITNGVSGAASPSGSCLTNASGDTVKLSVVGSVITCTDLTSGATYSWTDTTFSAGYPGIYAISQTAKGPFVAGSN